jgi:hypothetical protein
MRGVKNPYQRGIAAINDVFISEKKTDYANGGVELTCTNRFLQAFTVVQRFVPHFVSSVVCGAQRRLHQHKKQRGSEAVCMHAS